LFIVWFVCFQFKDIKALFIEIEISRELFFLLRHHGSKRSVADVEEDTEG